MSVVDQEGFEEDDYQDEDYQSINIYWTISQVQAVSRKVIRKVILQ